MSNIWNDDSESLSEFEMLEEATETEQLADSIESAPHEVYDFSDIDDSLIEEIQSESSFELNEKDVSSVYNVRIRLEQARLYEMLINHNIFEGVDASDQAINNVQNELKEYIVSRLELLMGIKQPVSETKEEIFIDQPFNDVEVEFLKALSLKGTNGASAGGHYTEPEIRRVETEIKPVKKVNKLKTLANKPKKIAPIEEPLRKSSKNKKLAPKPTKKKQVVKAKPKTNNRTVSQVEMIKGKKNMTKVDAQKIAEEEIRREKENKKDRKGKDWAKMTATEKAAEIKRANNRNAKPKPANALPMPDQSAINMHYQTQEAVRSGAGGKNQFNLMLANALASNK